MKTLIDKIYMVLLAALLLSAAGCSDDDDDTSLALNGDTWITSFHIEGYDNFIVEQDNQARSIKVHVEDDTDVTNLIPVFTLSEGATANLESGKPVNFTMPVVVKVTNGNVFMNYTISVELDKPQITGFMIGEYAGRIDETNKEIVVYVLEDMDITALSPVVTVPDGATVSPLSGTTLDFTTPKEYTVTNHLNAATYTVKVEKVRTFVSMAFIGTAATIDELTNNEEKAAAQWMLDNMPGARYISYSDLRDDNPKVKLDPEQIKVIWIHDDNPIYDDSGFNWNSKNNINNYYQTGGNLLLSRGALRYIVKDRWAISMDGRDPNNQFGSEDSKIVTDKPWGFSIKGISHEIFDGLVTEDNSNIYLINTGYHILNWGFQWCIDWEPYLGIEGWRQQTGAIELGYDVSNHNAVPIAEFPSRQIGGNSSGKVICIGMAAYDWYDENQSDNQYRGNIEKLTSNALDYLSK